MLAQAGFVVSLHYNTFFGKKLPIEASFINLLNDTSHTVTLDSLSDLCTPEEQVINDHLNSFTYGLSSEAKGVCSFKDFLEELWKDFWLTADDVRLYVVCTSAQEEESLQGSLLPILNFERCYGPISGKIVRRYAPPFQSEVHDMDHGPFCEWKCVRLEALSYVQYMKENRLDIWSYNSYDD